MESFWNPFWLYFWIPKTLKISVFVWKGSNFKKIERFEKRHLKRETWLSWNGKRVRLEGVQALQARREQSEHEETHEQERQGNEQQQGESGESLPRIETASPYDRLCPCGAATRPRRAV